MFSEFRAPHHPAGEPSLYSATLTKQLCPEDPDLSRLGHSGALGKSCLRSPQIPPVPYNRSLSVFSTRTLSPESSPPEVHPYPRVRVPQSCVDRAFVPTVYKRGIEIATTAPTHRPIFAPSRRCPGLSWPLPLCPSPLPPAPAPARSRAPLQLQQQAQGHSGLAVRTQRAPPRPGRPLPPLRPQPSAAQPAATNSAAGGGSTPGEPRGRAEQARPPPARRPPPPPHLARRRGRVPAIAEGRHVPCYTPRRVVPLAPRWWAPHGRVPYPRPRG